MSKGAANESGQQVHLAVAAKRRLTEKEEKEQKETNSSSMACPPDVSVCAATSVPTRGAVTGLTCTIRGPVHPDGSSMSRGPVSQAGPTTGAPDEPMTEQYVSSERGASFVRKA